MTAHAKLARAQLRADIDTPKAQVATAADLHAFHRASLASPASGDDIARYRSASGRRDTSRWQRSPVTKAADWIEQARGTSTVKVPRRAPAPAREMTHRERSEVVETERFLQAIESSLNETVIPDPMGRTGIEPKSIYSAAPTPRISRIPPRKRKAPERRSDDDLPDAPVYRDITLPGSCSDRHKSLVFAQGAGENIGTLNVPWPTLQRK